MHDDEKVISHVLAALLTEDRHAEGLSDGHSQMDNLVVGRYFHRLQRNLRFHKTFTCVLNICLLTLQLLLVLRPKSF